LKIYRKRYYLQLYSILLILTSVACSLATPDNATPVPEIPLTSLPSQPPHGISGGDSIGDRYIPSIGNTGYDVQAYLIDMIFSSHIDAITATVTLSSLVTLADLGRLSLDFIGYNVDGVQVDGQYVHFYRSPDKLYVDLPQSYAKGKTLVMKVSYHGQILSQGSQYINGFPLGLRTIPSDKLDYAVAEPNGAHAWFPCNDHPRDKAVYTFNLTVPAGFTAIANGTLLNVSSSSSQQTFHWREKFPMAPYLATVMVGNYQRVDASTVDNVIIRHYTFEGDPDYSNLLADTRDMMEYFSQLIASYPFDEFGFAFIHTVDDQKRFAEETQTMVMVDTHYMESQQAVGVLAHELAHQWFGDAVSLASWNEVWLKEGMATYLTALWLDHQGYVSLPDMMTSLENDLVSQANTFTYPLNQPPYAAMYGSSTYNKGAWVYHMLRQQIGDDNFTEFLRRYYKNFNGGNASTADVQALAREVSGIDLSTFFEEWVYAPGIPELTVTWVETDSGVSLQMCQAYGGQVYTFPLELGLQANDGSNQQQIITVDQLQEQVSYNTPFTVSSITTDPGQKVLADITINEVQSLEACTP
jgi:aminopeptidase N